MHVYCSATCFRPSCCWLSSGIQGHRAPGSEQLAQSTQDTAVWLATEGRSGARGVLWGKPISSIWFQTCAIWLIASVRRIKLRFHVILSTQHCISEEGKLISKRANSVRFTAQREADERSLIGVTLGKNTNIPARIRFCALQTLQPSFLAVYSSVVADDSHYLPCAAEVLQTLMQRDILFEPTHFCVRKVLNGGWRVGKANFAAIASCQKTTWCCGDFTCPS